MEKNVIVTLILLSIKIYSQVGINTPQPQATLDITAKSKNGTGTSTEGILIPRIDRQRAQSMSNPPISTLIFVEDATTGSQAGKAINIDVTGFYYFNGNIWIKMDTDVNIYNQNGVLGANRTVSLQDKSISFTGTSTNAFSIDGTTFSVNDANNRVGINTANPQAILSVANTSPGGLTDAFSSGINNCGAQCGQGTARNITLYNGNGTNSQFATIDFIPSTSPTGISGSSIKGIDRNGTNGYAGLQFLTRNATNFAARMTIKSTGNIGIGTEYPNSSAILDVASTSQGFLPPRMTTDQRDAITNKTAGLMIYNTSLNCMQYWNTQSWKGDCSTP